MRVASGPQLMALAGAAWGAALLLQPRAVLARTGTDPDRPGAVIMTRVLGARHLIQALALAARPGAVGPWAAVTDGLHAASMLGLAAVAPGYRKAALASATAAAALAAGTALGDGHRS